jgi:hypothetical protein
VSDPLAEAVGYSVEFIIQELRKVYSSEDRPTEIWITVFGEDDYNIIGQNGMKLPEKK